MTTDKTEMKTETICYGDCLEHLKRWVRWNNGIFEGKPSLADLIYLDPPWNSGRNYNHLFGPAESSTDNSQSAQEIAFEDMWKWDDKKAGKRVQRIILPKPNDWEYHNHPAKKSIFALKHLLGETGMLAYCAYMAERLALLREMLKPTGSIYLHCDPHASHYLKMVMDDIFGPKCYRNEIVWKYKYGGRSNRMFGRKHDIILCYGKTDQKDSKTQKNPETKTKFNILYKPYKENTQQVGKHSTLSGGGGNSAREGNADNRLVDGHKNSDRLEPRTQISHAETSPITQTHY